MAVRRRSLILLLHLCTIWAFAAAQGTCSTGCRCDDSNEEASVTTQEGLAAAVGALTPMVLGGAGLGFYKLFRGSTPALPNGPPSPNRFPGKRGSWPSDKTSPQPSLRSSRRGSYPMSIFSEDDDIDSFRPDTTSSFPNVHRADKGDTLNRWM